MSKALTALINEPLIWMLTPHGEGYALGWKGPSEFRDKAYTLFTNYYAPPKRGASPQLQVVSDDLTYIYLFNPESIRLALSLYFHVQAIMDGEVAVKKGWEGSDEGDEVAEYRYEPDEITAAKIGAASADAFMLTIKQVNFIPPPPETNGAEYGIGHFAREERFGVEDLASAI